MFTNYINANQDFLAFICVALAMIFVWRFYIYKHYLIFADVVYLALVFHKTVWERITKCSVRNMDFLWSYRALMDGTPGMFSQIYLNVMLFVPLGLFSYGVLKGKREGVWTIVFGMTLSISIEFMQLFFHRGIFELDDILNNTIGASIGTLIAYGIECSCTKRERKNDKKCGTIQK